jgi:uncharacterized protein (TIRG00374 family)
MENKSAYLKYGLHLAIFAGLIWAIVKYVNGQEVLKTLREFNLIYLPWMLLLALLYFLLKALRFVLLMSPFTDSVPNSIVFKGYISGQPATLLPGGVAARAGLMKQAGVPLAQSSVPVAFDSLWDQAFFFLGGLVAAWWFPGARLPVLVITGVLAVIAALLLLKPTRMKLARLADRVAKHFDQEESWHRFLDSIPQMFSRKILLGCIGITAVAFAFQIITLYLTLRGLDLSVPAPTLFLAFVLPTMLGRLVPVPGGIGVTEASMVGFLTQASDLNTDTAVAAVAVFRVVTIVIPALVGAIVYYTLWHGAEGANSRNSSADNEEPHAQKTIEPAGSN